MAKDFTGKRVLVTGAGSGIGKATLLGFAKLGADVIAVDLHQETAEATAAEARERNVLASAHGVDVSDEAAMVALAKAVARDPGVPDIVINNAGIGLAGSFLDTTLDDWRDVLNVNLNGVIHGSHLFAWQMVEAGKGGTIVNVASAAAFTPLRTMSAYCTSKAAVRMLSDCMRADLADKNIHVVCVCPGIINTPITQNTRFVGVDDGEQSRLRDNASKLYNRRNLPPEAVADAIIKAVAKQRAEVVVGSEAKALQLLSRTSPTLSRTAARLDITPK